MAQMIALALAFVAIGLMSGCTSLGRNTSTEAWSQRAADEQPQGVSNMDSWDDFNPFGP